MAKHDRRKRSSQPPSSRTVTIQVPLPVLGVLNGVREAFHGLCIKTGMQVLEAMMEGDREDLCGPKGRHQVERPAWRGGSVASDLDLGGWSARALPASKTDGGGLTDCPRSRGPRPPTRTAAASDRYPGTSRHAATSETGLAGMRGRRPALDRAGHGPGRREPRVRRADLRGRPAARQLALEPRPFRAGGSRGPGGRTVAAAPSAPKPERGPPPAMRVALILTASGRVSSGHRRFPGRLPNGTTEQLPGDPVAPRSRSRT